MRDLAFARPVLQGGALVLGAAYLTLSYVVLWRHTGWPWMGPGTFGLAIGTFAAVAVAVVLVPSILELPRVLVRAMVLGALAALAFAFLVVATLLVPQLAALTVVTPLMATHRVGSAFGRAATSSSRHDVAARRVARCLRFTYLARAPHDGAWFVYDWASTWTSHYRAARPLRRLVMRLGFGRRVRSELLNKDSLALMRSAPDE